MSYDTYYWLIMSVAFILTHVVGVLLMLKTQKLLLSFLASLAANLAVLIPASLWWASMFEGFALVFGLSGYGIAFVNTEVLVFFAIFIMKKKKQMSTEQSS
ncbi:hypothetical protein DVH26_08855 [Paenibacillus sp. H1-7]|uniref:hypothetical protein n=1 Tax=Paenibacillus sp. H1-7 TaxID=2282849 RepID=UPI001EF8EF7C|nr:hypothetical protein [Paenibacillus sp. H1-7]ULL14547.1 hypothetical protein DVH26_08855 [Paenibacillus sp. H1-7]